MKKTLFVFLAGIIGFYGFSFAWNEFSYENAKNLANEYIVNSSFDENWKDTHPHVEGEGKYFYTDADTPSYVEFKVSCDKNPHCGFVMVNFDGDDVSIPIASTSGNTPSEVLAAKNGSDAKKNKLYYFNPFEQYAENVVTGDVASIDPQDDFGDEVSGTEKLTPEIKKEKKSKKNKSLKDKIMKAKSDAKEFKKSDDFKKKRKELKDKKQTIPKEEVSFKYLDMALAGSTQVVNGATYVTGSSTANCNSRVPCYTQFTYNYASGSCLSGCTPTAVAMLFGYHDRVGNYPNLVSGVAKDYIIGSTTDTNITNMVNSIRGYIGTYCESGQGSSTGTNIPMAYKYAVSKGYLQSMAYRSTGTPTYLMGIIKTEINKGNPIIINTIKHSLVGYGYNNTLNSLMVRVNYGWGNPTSNIDVNINSIDVKGTPYTISSTVRFDIK